MLTRWELDMGKVALMNWYANMQHAARSCSHAEGERLRDHSDALLQENKRLLELLGDAAVLKAENTSLEAEISILSPKAASQEKLAAEREAIIVDLEREEREQQQKTTTLLAQFAEAHDEEVAEIDAAATEACETTQRAASLMLMRKTLASWTGDARKDIVTSWRVNRYNAKLKSASLKLMRRVMAQWTRDARKRTVTNWHTNRRFDMLVESMHEAFTVPDDCDFS